MRCVLLLSCLTVVVPLSADAAQVYRCVDDSGRVEYRDLPCAGRSGSAITIEPNVTREIDQSAYRAASKAVSDRAAARAAAENQAAIARSSAVRSAGGPGVATGSSGTPWWQQGGPPPDRDTPTPTPIDPSGGGDNTKPPPPIGTTPTPLPVSPGQARPLPARPAPPPATPPPAVPGR